MILINLIQSFFCFFLGAVFGNVCTTLFYRIPRDIPINGIEAPPMCSNCGKKIKSPYYLPFLHVILNGFKTKCCNQKIPKIYFFIELFVAIFCAFYFFFNPINSIFIIRFLLIVTVFLAVLIYIKNEKFYDRLNWIILTLSLIRFAYELNIMDDLLFSLLTHKLIYGIITFILFKALCNSKKIKLTIQEICFLILLSIGMNLIMYAGFSLASIILFSIFDRKKGVFLLPLLPAIFF